jgi:acyl-coenzyme A synthetase/AMP-(fatty) acid ligase
MIIDHIYEWARVNPNRAAIIYNDVAISYGEFAKGIEITRKFLTRQQLPQASTAALLIQNHLGCWIVGIASRAIGLNTIALKTVPQAQQVEIREPSCLITLDTEVGDLEIPSNINARVIVVPETIYANVQECELPPRLEMYSLYGDHILYTSGTTGIHKKLLWCAQDEDRRTAARGAFYKFDTRTVLHVLNYAVWTGAGFRGCLSAWMFGGCVVIDRTKKRFSKFFQHNITNSVLLPSMLDQVLSTCGTRVGSSEPKLDVGGSLAKRKQILRAIDRLSCKITVGYFCSELILPPLISSVCSEDDVEWLSPQPERDISIVKDDRVLNGINEEGFLRIALTDLDSTSYYEEAGGKSAFDGGYFYPGDMAVRRADGRIRILGRVDDVIDLQGQKVAVAPIEQNLQQHLEADEVCLFAGLNDAGQEELIVAIQASSRPAQAKLDDVRKQFKGFELVRFQVLEQFPRTDTGKVRRIILKNLLTKGR